MHQQMLLQPLFQNKNDIVLIFEGGIFLKESYFIEVINHISSLCCNIGAIEINKHKNKDTDSFGIVYPGEIDVRASKEEIALQRMQIDLCKNKSIYIFLVCCCGRFGIRFLEII